MGPHRRSGDKSSTASKHPQSLSPGRVNKPAKSTGKTTAISGSGLLLHGGNQLTSPMKLRAVAAKDGLQQQQQQSNATSSSSSAPVPTNNSYDVLDEDNDVDLPLAPGSVEGQQKKSTAPKERLPPIFVVDTLYTTVDDFLMENEISFSLTLQLG